jgi:hypothetical protein
MEKNKLLNIAIIICKGVRIFYIFLFIALTSVLIHFQFSPESYKELKYDSKNSGNFIFHTSTVSNTKNTVTDETKNIDVFSFSEITKTSVFFNYLQFSAIFIFIFLSVKEFQFVIESVKKLKTFQNNNVTSFRKIGKYIFIIFLLMSYTNVQFQEIGKIGFQLELTPLLFVLIAFIMAEIFKEGNSLQEENDLTI